MFLREVLKARSVQKKLHQLKRAKERAYLIHLNKDVQRTLSEDIFFFWARLEARLLRVVPCRERVARFIARARDEDSLTHFTLKSAAGFLAGVLLTYMMFVVMVAQIGLPLHVATKWCGLVVLGLPLGLAFSSRVRCFCLLLLPQLCSARGRQALLAYALMITLTGPASNALQNAHVLADSLRCGQDSMRDATRAVLELVAQPLRALRDAIKKVLSKIKEAVRTIRDMLITVKRAIMSVFNAIKAAVEWLSGVVSMCNTTVGTPFQRCMRSFDQASADCYATMGSAFGWMCSPVSLVQNVCYAVKLLDYICDLFDLVSDVIVGSVKKKLRDFGRHVQRALYVSVDIEHSFSLQTSRSKTMKEIAEAMGREIRERTSALLATFRLFNGMFSLCFLVVFFRVWLYRYRFLTQDHFDNRFITAAFRRLDWNRARQGREIVLPLTLRERRRYITTWSPHLGVMERVKVAKSVGRVVGTAVVMAVFMAADYFLYWMLAIVYVHGQFQAHVDVPPHIGVKVEGTGVIAKLYRSVIETFQPADETWDMDSVPCLPRPFEPDLVRYIQVGSLTVMCVLLSVLEPFALRTRNWVMNYYHPARGQERAVWLYNHVMRARLTLSKMLRRQLRRQIESLAGKPQSPLERISWLDWLRARFPVTRLVLGAGRQECCLLCAGVERGGDPSTRLWRCWVAGCDGRYCVTCFADLSRVCTACKTPADYGDMSDVSEELGSSADEPGPPKADEQPESRSRKKRSERSGLGRAERLEERGEETMNIDKEDDEDRSADVDPLLRESGPAARRRRRRRGRSRLGRPSSLSFSSSSSSRSRSSSSSSSHLSYSYQCVDPRDEDLPPPPWPRFHDVEAQRLWDPATLDQLRAESAESGNDSAILSASDP